MSWSNLGPHFLCWILGVVPFSTWLISSWEENKCCYKLSKCTKWLKLSFRVKMVVIVSVAQLVTPVIFFTAWDKSRVKWDNSWNSTQKMRTFILGQILSKKFTQSRKLLTFKFVQECICKINLLSDWSGNLCPFVHGWCGGQSKRPCFCR